MNPVDVFLIAPIVFIRGWIRRAQIDDVTPDQKPNYETCDKDCNASGTRYLKIGIGPNRRRRGRTTLIKKAGDRAECLPISLPVVWKTKSLFRHFGAQEHLDNLGLVVWPLSLFINPEKVFHPKTFRH